MRENDVNTESVEATGSNNKSGNETGRDENGFLLSFNELTQGPAWGVIQAVPGIIFEMMWMQQRFEGIYNEKSIVTRGSVISCIYGTDDVRIDCEEDDGVTYHDEPPMTTKDCETENLHTFGVCICPGSLYEGVLPKNTAEDPDGRIAEGIAKGHESAQMCRPMIARD